MTGIVVAVDEIGAVKASSVAVGSGIGEGGKPAMNGWDAGPTAGDSGGDIGRGALGFNGAANGGRIFAVKKGGN